MATRRFMILAAAAVVAIGCGGESSPADTSEADASSVEECVTARLGHCVDTATGEPCLDFEAPTRTFNPLDDTTVVQPITGNQGADMFVLALRCPGIEPGDVSDSPRVEVSVFFGDDRRGGYQSFPDFIADPDEPTAPLAPQLYTVVELPPEGQTLRAVGQATDAAGNLFCAEASFVVGALIERDVGHH